MWLTNATVEALGPAACGGRVAAHEGLPGGREGGGI
jgi:hypothetical protein